MNFSDLMTIIGVIATIGFGILSYIMVKRKRYPGKLILVKQSKISLFNNIARNFDEISISYKNSPIKENIIYIKSCFINDGDIDIEGGAVEKPICLTFKSGFKWIKGKITETSNELNCNSNISDGGEKLEFNFGLFRKKEFIQFEALIESNNENYNSDNVFDNIEINHRISNTQKITTTSLLTEEQIKKKKNRIKSDALIFGIQVLFLLVLLFVSVFFLKNTEIHYIDKAKNEYKATAKTDNTVELKNIKTKDKSIVAFNDFCDLNKFTPIIPQETKWQKIKSIWYILPMFLASLLFMVIIDYIQISKANRINRILKCVEK